jgi:hypothetical protein
MLRWVVKPRRGMNWESMLKIFRGGFEQRSQSVVVPFTLPTS